MRPLDSEIALLLDSLDEAFDKKSWHSPNLRGSIRGVSVREAAWRPAPKSHNIWEYTLHAAYWKYVSDHRREARVVRVARQQLLRAPRRTERSRLEIGRRNSGGPASGSAARRSGGCVAGIGIDHLFALRWQAGAPTPELQTPMFLVWRLLPLK